MEDNKVENDLGMKPLDDDFFKGGERTELLPRSKMVFVTGILFTIFGAMALFNVVLSFINQGAQMDILKQQLTEEGIRKMLEISPIVTAFACLMGVVELLAGVVGILYSRVPKKAFFVISLGILLIGMTIINSTLVARKVTQIMLLHMKADMEYMLQMSSRIMQMSTFIGLLLSLVVPVLYLIGGFILYKRKIREEEAL